MGNAIPTPLPVDFVKFSNKESLWVVVPVKEDSPAYLIGESGRSWLCDTGKSWIAQNGGVVWLIGEGGVFEYPSMGSPVERSSRQIPENVLVRGSTYIKEYTGAGTAVQTGVVQSVFTKAASSMSDRRGQGAGVAAASAVDGSAASKAGATAGATTANKPKAGSERASTSALTAAASGL